MFTLTDAASDGLHAAGNAPALLLAAAIESPSVVWLGALQIVLLAAFRMWKAYLDNRKETAVEVARVSAQTRAEAEEAARGRLGRQQIEREVRKAVVRRHPTARAGVMPEPVLDEDLAAPFEPNRP